jgi:hypothetical protein
MEEGKIACCGLACEVCKLYNKKVCGGCLAGNSSGALEWSKKLKEMGHPCPILDCAIKKNVGYCPKDCKDFPCEIYYKEFPFSKKFLDIFK